MLYSYYFIATTVFWLNFCSILMKEQNAVEQNLTFIFIDLCMHKCLSWIRPTGKAEDNKMRATISSTQNPRQVCPSVSSCACYSNSPPLFTGLLFRHTAGLKLLLPNSKPVPSSCMPGCSQLLGLPARPRCLGLNGREPWNTSASSACAFPASACCLTVASESCCSPFCTCIQLRKSCAGRRIISKLFHRRHSKRLPLLTLSCHSIFW